MTFEEAEAEAKRRWGKTGAAGYWAAKTGVYCMVGRLDEKDLFPGIPTKEGRWNVISTTFEKAFAVVDAVMATKGEARRLAREVQKEKELANVHRQNAERLQKHLQSLLESATKGI